MVVELGRVESLFAKVKGGNRDALFDLIEAERPRLFDYLLRMTGQRDRSLEVLEEVSKALSSHPQQYTSLQSFRVSLYSTLRSFAADIWNADTSQLINESYADAPADVGDDKYSEDDLRRVENGLAALPGWEREPIILALRYGFNTAHIAEITGIDMGSLSYSMKSGIAKIGRSSGFDFDAVEQIVVLLPAHANGRESMHATAALSQIMGDIGKARRGLGYFNWQTFVVFGVLAAAAVYFLFFF